MRILIACEFSGTVRDAFRAAGHDAWSCDILPSEGHGIYHLQGDVRRVLDGHIPHDMVGDSAWRPTPMFRQWDMLIAHPPCTYLANSGNKHLYLEADREEKAQEAAAFFRVFLDCKIPRKAIENPIMRHAVERVGRKCDQIVQPWWFGHGESKATCFWLENLPPLKPTRIVEGRTPRVHFASPGPDRWKERSRTLPGLAAAMVIHWGNPNEREPAKDSGVRPQLRQRAGGGADRR